MTLFPRVEILSPGWLKDGRRFFVVDLVEGNGERSGMWDGTDYGEAILAAGDMADEDLPVIDRVVEGQPDA